MDAQEKTSSTGNQMIEIALAVTTPDGKNGPRVWDRLVFSPKAYWKIDAFRIATGETLTKGQSVTFEAEDCVDRQGKVRLMIETYQGRESNRVEAVHRSGRGEGSAEDRGEILSEEGGSAGLRASKGREES